MNLNLPSVANRLPWPTTLLNSKKSTNVPSQLTSTHVLELREDTTRQLRTIRDNADAQAREQKEIFARMTELIATLTSRISA